MKKMIISFFVLTILFSCKKDVVAPNDERKKDALSSSVVRPGSNLRLPYGTAKDRGGRTSGVNATTGYTVLVKHLVNGVWNNTYDFPWYENTLNVTIATYANNAAFGDPVFAQSFTSPQGGVSATPYTGFGTQNMPPGGFMMDYIIWNPSTITYTPPFSVWNPAANNGSGAWIDSDTKGSWNIGGGGSFVVHDYGKLIKVTEGSGIAAAELDWSVSGSPPSTGTQNTITLRKQFGTHPTPPSTITVDFIQNGVVIKTGTFPATPTGTVPITIPPGTYTLKFTVPAGYENYFINYMITPGATQWEGGTGSRVVTTGSVNIQPSVSYTLTASQM